MIMYFSDKSTKTIIYQFVRLRKAIENVGLYSFGEHGGFQIEPCFCTRYTTIFILFIFYKETFYLVAYMLCTDISLSQSIKYLLYQENYDDITSEIREKTPIAAPDKTFLTSREQQLISLFSALLVLSQTSSEGTKPQISFEALSAKCK